jgi:ubiquinone/menaquinone biosynthesis C-methylase UbiE
MTEVRHPLFARLYARVFSRLMEKDLGEHRSDLLSGLSGRVIEIGAGNGMNFRHYPATVDEVIAVEPEPYLRASARQSAEEAATKVTVVDGLADALPLRDGDFDAAVVCLVLCTVPGQAGALAEVRRVLARGGELRFLEHVRSDRPLQARVQMAADGSGVWPRLAGGCHCARDTLGAIADAGFDIEHARTFDLGPSWGLTNPHVRGVARRRE